MSLQILSTTQAATATRALNRLSNAMEARNKALQHLNRAVRQIEEATRTLAKLRLEMANQQPPPNDQVH